MIKYLIDANVAVEFYRPKATFKTTSSYKASLNLRKHLITQKASNKAIIFIPSFCIAEVRNTLGKWYNRNRNIFKSKAHYESNFRIFVSHIHDRKFFYSYDLNRYHNISTSEVIEIEHTNNTEYNITGLPRGTDRYLIDQKLKKRNKYDHSGKYYLSTLDILIIAMGIELKRIHGDEIHLLTGDKRLALISSKKPGLFPKPYYWYDITVSDLPK